MLAGKAPSTTGSLGIGNCAGVSPLLSLHLKTGPNISKRFLEILKQNPGPQMTYQVAFCFWLLTFEQDIANQIDKYAIAPLHT